MCYYLFINFSIWKIFSWKRYWNSPLNTYFFTMKRKLGKNVKPYIDSLIQNRKQILTANYLNELFYSKICFDFNLSSRPNVFIHFFTVKFNPFSCSQRFYNFCTVHMVSICMFYALIYTENSEIAVWIVYCVFCFQQKSLLSKVNQLKINKWN